MAKDYFQDIIPPGDDPSSPQNYKPRPLPPKPSEEPVQDSPRSIPIQGAEPSGAGEEEAPPRGIRSIPAPQRPRPPYRPSVPPQAIERDFRDGPPLPRRRASRLWLWAAASLFVLAFVAGLLFFFGSTTVTVHPKSRMAILNATTLKAREVSSASPGELSYTMQTFDFEDSDVVAAQGTIRVETKASGSITVSNAHSATSVKLVKNTRFESPQGLIYRATSDIVVPGKKGSTPGTVNVTVIADLPGERYNIGPAAKFTLPGLKTNPAMYAAVTAKSSAAMSGGAAGDKPGAAPGVLEAAIASVRGRMESKAHDAAAAQVKDGDIVFSELIAITYESAPATKEAGDSVRIHEKAHVEVPVFSKDAFAQAIAKAAFTDTDNLPVTMEPQGDFSVRALAPDGRVSSGVLDLVASGNALIVWKVDSAALAAALQGKDSSAFQAIADDFPSVADARARIVPFWKNTFPADAADIEVVVLKPDAAK